MRHGKRMLSVLTALAMVLTMGLSIPNKTANVHAEENTDGITVVSSDTKWQYREDNTVPADGWKTSEAVTEDAWKTAEGSFGAKNGAIADLGGGCVPKTLLKQYIDGTTNDIPVYYFRKNFDAADVSMITSVTGSLMYDDAAVVYINGVKIAGFDDGSFDENGYGGSNASAPKEGIINFTDIASLNLKAKENVLSVELHNGRPSSSDVYLEFKSLVLGTQQSQEPKEAEVKYVSLNIGGDETQKNVTWMTTSDKDSYVQVIAKPAGWTEDAEFPAGAMSFKASVESDASGKLDSSLKICKATITGILENTTYLYRVGNDEKWSDTYTFTAQKLGNEKEFNFLFAGDPQIGASGNSVSDTENWQTTMSRSMAVFPQTSFLLSAGDQINDKGSKEVGQYEGFLSPEALRTIPLAANVGNHDSGSSLYSAFYNMPNVSTLGTSGGTGAESGDYWFMYNGTLVMCINSNNTDTATHKEFLEKTIAAHEDAEWKVVAFHHSTYSVANHYTDSDIVKRREELSPVFSELGIDVVLMGHDHYYTRTYMMDGSNAVIPEGHDVKKGEEAPTSVANPEEGQVFYLTANSASGSKYYKRNGQLANGWPEFVAVQDQSNRPTITNVTVTKNAFTVETYYTDSDTLQLMDTFTIYHTEDPVITVPQNEDGKTTIEVGTEFDPMTGVSAADWEGNDLTQDVKVTVYNADTQEMVQSVDTSAAGNYRIVYEVTDAYGKTAEAEQMVSVIEGSDPGNKPSDGDTEKPGDGNNSGTTVKPGNGQNGGNGSQATGQNQPGKNTHSSTVKTGDTAAPVVLFSVIMMLAAAAVAVLMYKRMRQRHI